jgi:hypothetical protein
MQVDNPGPLDVSAAENPLPPSQESLQKRKRTNTPLNDGATDNPLPPIQESQVK